MWNWIKRLFGKKPQERRYGDAASFATPVAGVTSAGAPIIPVYDSAGAATVSGMGEVQANPSANTVLARLKDLLTGIVLAAGEAIIGKARLVDSGGTEVTEAAGHTVKVSGTVTSTVTGTVGIDQATANANEVVVKSITAGTNAIGRVGHDVGGIAHGRKVVATAGTDEALAASTAAKYVIITADAGNSGIICVGGTGVDAVAATRTGIPLSAGGSCGLDCDNLADIFIDATVSGEGVSFAYLT